MPGFTHLKNAQPVLFSHYLLAYVEMFKRDFKKFKNVINNTSENPWFCSSLEQVLILTEILHLSY